MTIDLSKITFDNDFYSVMLTDGSLLKINRIDEDFMYAGHEIDVSALNIEITVPDETESIVCPSVIGLANDYFVIRTDYEEYLGHRLTEDNMRYCIIETVEA